MDEGMLCTNSGTWPLTKPVAATADPAYGICHSLLSVVFAAFPRSGDQGLRFLAGHGKLGTSSSFGTMMVTDLPGYLRTHFQKYLLCLSGLFTSWPSNRRGVAKGVVKNGGLSRNKKRVTPFRGVTR